MEKSLQLAYLSKNRPEAEKIALILSENGFEVELVQKEVNPSEVVLLLLMQKDEEKSLLQELPWLQEQAEYSSYRGFRLMPLLAFHPQKEDPEALWEEGIGGVIEGLLSGEFKPFGWDLDRKDLDPEFLRILEESYSE